MRRAWTPPPRPSHPLRACHSPPQDYRSRGVGAAQLAGLSYFAFARCRTSVTLVQVLHLSLGGELGRPIAHFLSREERPNEPKESAPAGGAGTRFLPRLPRVSSESRSALSGKNRAHDRRRTWPRPSPCTAARRRGRAARGLFTRPGRGRAGVP